MLENEGLLVGKAFLKWVNQEEYAFRVMFYRKIVI